MKEIKIQDISSGKSKFKLLQRWFITGLIVLGPLMLTAWIVFQIFKFADGVLGKPIQWFLGDFLAIPFFEKYTIPGIGFLTLVILILISGWFARQYLGNRVVKLVSLSMERIPLVNKVYLAILQISEALLGGQKEVFKQAVLLEYPRRGMWCIGFITQDTRGPVQESIEDDVISVFLPTTPNPTSGYLLFVPKTEVSLLNVSVEEALKLIISAGAVVPRRGGSPEDVAESMGIDTGPYKNTQGNVG